MSISYFIVILLFFATFVPEYTIVFHNDGYDQPSEINMPLLNRIIIFFF